MKPMPGLAEAALDASAGEADFDPERGEHVRSRRTCEEAARLPCLATGTPHAATIKAASVDTL